MAKEPISNVDATLRLLREMPRDLQRDVRKTVTRNVAGPLARKIAAAGAGSDRQSAGAARSVKAVFDRVPTIRAGGSRKATSDGATAGDIFFGAEFGGGSRKTTRQFRPHRGQTGYWYWPTVRSSSADVEEQWASAIDSVLQAWGQG